MKKETTGITKLPSCKTVNREKGNKETFLVKLGYISPCMAPCGYSIPLSTSKKMPPLTTNKNY